MAETVETDRALLHAIIRFYREELRARYSLENVRRFENFDGVADAQVGSLRSYFLEHIYPPPEKRDTLDDAINRMGDVLRSPRRLRPLIGTTFTSVFRLGTSLPTAIGAGLSTLDAYTEARKLEGAMLDAARQLGLSPADEGDRKELIRILGIVDERDVKRLIKDIMKLFHALSDTKMLATAIDFLEKCTVIMVQRPDLYAEQEVKGITLGRQMVQGGHDLFLELRPEQFPRIIAGIEQVEWEWYHAARDEARAQS